MGLRVRAAVGSDEQLLLDLAASVSGAGGNASWGVEGALAEGEVWLAEADDTAVGYLCVERPRPNHVRLTGIGVLPGHRRRGVGRVLVERLLTKPDDEEDGGTTVSAVVEPTQTAGIELLLACGFIGDRILRVGVAGDGVQMHLRHQSRTEYVDPEARYLVPIADTAQLVESLGPDDRVVTALARLAGGPAFEISRFEQDDPAALQSGEAQAGIAFAGAILAALTFLVGFSFASARYPDDIRLLLIAATFATTMSLIIYASAAGELARIRANAFGRIMKWGNVVSEYGGVLPFLVSLPITYAQLAGAAWTAVALGAALTLGLLVYERSEFSIASRFRRSAFTRALALATSLAPLGSALLAACGAPSWPWTAALVLALAGRTGVSLLRRGPESGISEFRRTLQIRK
ncbi:GNAT family N-acetyltransferase [Kitasatospora sp. NPDC004669]|uniref:GNAT family N-acetyltransferase n=1 Tax=Kitasatospora sp. NPDC004669 TaxID=3154555 RepID=UPI0033B2995F